MTDSSVFGKGSESADDKYDDGDYDRYYYDLMR